MDGFFKALGDKTKELKKAVNDVGKPKPNFAGGSGGQSLGGTKPGEVLTMIMEQPGPLGIKVEKSPSGSGTAIVSDVVPNSQAARADLQRGDIVCVVDTGGQLEMPYKEFLERVKSPQRPLVFDVRRMSSSASAARDGHSADALARRRAVVAAAEARDKAHKAKTKPVVRKTLTTLQQESGGGLANHDIETEPLEPLSEESRLAVQQAKADEAKLAQELGYNPYEVTKLNSGQAKTAAVNTTHGSVSVGGSGSSGGAAVAPGSVAPPVAPAKRAEEEEKVAVVDWSKVPPVSEAFEDAWTTLVTSGTDSDALQNSLGILQKLLVNATTKFREEKYRRVKLSNAKIQAAVTQVAGALEVLLACGFALGEEQEETLLLYPWNGRDDQVGPAWLPRALQQMETYATSV